MNPQIERDLRKINVQFLAMLVFACLFGAATYYGLALLIRYAVARLMQAL